MATEQETYAKQAIEILKRVAAIHADDQKWVHVITKEGTTLHKKEYPKVCRTPCYLTSTTIAKPKTDLVNMIWVMDESKAKVNDPNLTMWKEIAKGNNWKVCSQYNKAKWPIWPRHIKFAQVRFDSGKSTKLVAFSVDHPDAKTDTSTHVEAKVHMSVYDFIDNDDNTTTINRVTQVDPCGDLPTWLVNSYATNQVDMFNRWKK